MYNFNNLFNFPIQKKDMTRKKLAQYQNDYVFYNIFSKLLTDYLASWKIENITDTMNERVFKQVLTWYGFGSITEKDGNYLTLATQHGGNFNVYGEPSDGFIFGYQGFNEHVKFFLPGSDKSTFLRQTTSTLSSKSYNSVFIRSNDLMYPFINTIIYYAQSIADCYRKLDVCRANLAQPFLISADETQVNNVKRFFDNRDNNESIIISTGVFPANSISLLPFDTNEQAVSSLTSLIDWYKNQYKEEIGQSNNSNIDKKGENLIQAEVSVNNEYTSLSLQKQLDSINRGLEIANDLWGTDFKAVKNEQEKEVDYYDDFSGDNSERSNNLDSRD